VNRTGSHAIILGVISFAGDEIHSGISIGGLTLVFDRVHIKDENQSFLYIEEGGIMICMK
jgi:hypothetical protein